MQTEQVHMSQAIPNAEQISTSNTRSFIGECRNLIQIKQKVLIIDKLQII